MSHDLNLVCGWIRLVDAAQTDIVQLYGQRVVWRDIVAMLEAKETIPGRFFIRNVLTQWYLTHQLSGIRRHQDLNRGTASLARIWDSMGRHAHLVRRDRYVEWTSIDDYTRALSSQDFDNRYGLGLDHLHPDVAQSHVDRLKNDLADVRRFVNRRIAHLRSNPESSGQLTFGRINAALAVLEEELNSLSLLARGVGIPEAEPVIQDPWRGAFFVPWASEDEIQQWQEAVEAVDQLTDK